MPDATSDDKDPRAQYGTPLLYEKPRNMTEAIADITRRLIDSEPAAGDLPVSLLRKGWLMRCHGGALRWWLRRADAGLCRTPGGRGRLVDAFCAYRAARADLMLALLAKERGSGIGDRKGVER